MSFSRPRSFLQLVLLGFALVALPLIIAIINAILAVDRLADRSEQAVLEAADITKHSQDIVEHLIDMERMARQYDVLGDAELFVAYKTAHEQFVSMTSTLGRLPLDDKQQQDLQILIETELAVFHALGGASGPADVGTEKGASRQDMEAEQATASAKLGHDQALQRFQSLTQFAISIRTTSELVVHRQAERMQHAAQKSKKMLVWQALAVIPGAMLFAIIFVALISRPIRQIRQAIRRLGEGDFHSPMAISGPRDLENLGESLAWLQTRLQELEDAKRQFLGKVSHELKTPLAAIREGVSLMADGIVGEVTPAQREIVDILQQKCRHLQALLENLVNFSMAHARQAAVVRLPVELHDLVERVVMDHKPGMLAKTIKLDMDAAATVVMGDGDKLRTVIDNLISNAVKYTSEGGAISVTLQSRGDYAILDVIDDGIGIPKTEQHKIFEPFYQRGSTPNGYLKGNGLGLAIAHEYLAAHDGAIDVIDRSANGAHFRVSLPIGQ